MAFPHPQTRKDHYGKEDKPRSGGVLWNFVKRTIDVAEYRNTQDDVNPAMDCTLLGDLCSHGLSLLFEVQWLTLQAA
jgi:hypothetical protein